MPAPPADMLVSFNDESIPDGTKDTVEECLQSAGFHTFWEAGLNVRPFELTDKNESLLSETIDEIQAALPEVEVTQQEGANKDRGRGVTYSYYLTIGKETESNTERWEGTGSGRVTESNTDWSKGTDSEIGPSWRQSNDGAKD